MQKSIVLGLALINLFLKIPCFADRNCETLAGDYLEARTETVLAIDPNCITHFIKVAE